MKRLLITFLVLLPIAASASTITLLPEPTPSIFAKCGWHFMCYFKPQFGSTITTINGTDTISASRPVINTNFSNLNTDKLENGSTATTLTVGTLTLTNPLSVANGGTNATSLGSNQVLYGGTSGSKVATVATTSVSFGSGIGVSGTAGALLGGTPLTLTNSAPSVFSTTTIATSIAPAGATAVGIGTTTPFTPLEVGKSGASAANFGQLSLTDTNAGGNLKHWIFSSLGGNFYVGTTTDSYATSSPSALTIFNSGEVAASGESLVATSSVTTLDWKATRNQAMIRIGTGSITVSVINATTSEMLGSRKVIYVCNPGTTGGSLTWTGVEWIGTAPVQTTAANQCDIYSLDITSATSTAGVFKVAGAAGLGFQ